MPVSYTYIDTLLNPCGLNNPCLDVLIPDHHRYSTMLYQHQGDLIANVTPGSKFIGNKESDDAHQKHMSFFELALSKSIQLVLTPEYSCPHSVIPELLSKEIFPSEHHLWVIGCESIKPFELKAFVKQHSSEDTIILAEDSALNSNEDKILDPICYLFNTSEQNTGKLKRVLVFQFKTFPMGATSIEAENLLFGTRRFIIRNNEDSIYLATIICSESLEIDLSRELRQFADKPYLLLHPQMNSGARTNAFKSYRTNFYNACVEDSDKELICLNWSKGSTIAEKELGYSSSALYTKAKKINLEDGRIAKNDLLGLYFNWWNNARTSVLVFDQNEAIYQFENSKTSKRPLNVQNQGRFGPEMLNRFIWFEGQWQEKEIQNNELLESACKEINGDLKMFIEYNLSSIDKERLLSLSAGVISDKNWASPQSSLLFRMDNSEESSRLSLYQDPPMQDTKRIWLNRYASITTGFLKQGNFFPTDSHLQDLENKPSIQYLPPNFQYNIIAASGIPGCVVYAGDSDPSTIGELKANLLSSAKGDNNYRLRLMIVYQYLGQLCKDYETSGPDINGNGNDSPIAINKKRQ
nr:hypothetical protein [uncultured Pedobacter sp.]